jgi:hypothetical protein
VPHHSHHCRLDACGLHVRDRLWRWDLPQPPPLASLRVVPPQPALVSEPRSVLVLPPLELRPLVREPPP